MSEPTTTFATIDITSLRLRLRRGLRFVPQRVGGALCVVIEDEATGRCFRLGRAEADLASRLDGRRTLGQALADAAIAGVDPLTEEDAVRVCSWLVENELAETGASRRASRLDERRRKQRRRTRLGKLNPIAIRVPLFDPDRILRPLAPLGRLLFSRLGGLAWLLLVSIGAATLLTQWSAFAAQAAPLTSPHIWPLVAAATVVLKVLHEAAHGLACQAFGGRPRQAGVLLLLLVPLPFIDVSGVWACPSRPKRILVSAAGMMLELAVASAAIIAWSQSRSPVLVEVLRATIYAAGLVTVLFNANPLMKFDGYYMLSDAIDIPNLSQRGQQIVAGLSQSVFYGLPYDLRGQDRWGVVLTYGVAAAVWRVVIWCSLLAAACVLLDGAGRLVAVAGFAAWLLPMIGRNAKRIVAPKLTERPVRLGYVAGWSLLVASGVLMVVAGLQRPAHIVAHGVVVGPNRIELRATSAGFVATVHVQDGEHVDAGAVIATLENETLRERRRQLELDLEQAKLIARGQHARLEIAAMQATRRRVDALRSRLRQTDEAIGELRIRVPLGGRVIWPRSEESLGRYVSSGAAVASLEADGPPEVVAVLSQEAVDAVPAVSDWRGHLAGATTSVVLTRRKQDTSRLTRRLPHPLIGAQAGGAVAVRSDGRGQMELAQPHATSRFALPDAAAAPIGSRVTIRGRLSRRVSDDVVEIVAAIRRTLQ